MAITYNNPDEVVKVKHILSLAEHIAEKIDGSGDSSSTTSKAIPTISSTASEISSSSWVDSGAARLCTSTPTISYNGDGNFWVSRTATSAGLRLTAANNDVGTGNIYLEMFYLKTRPITFPLTLTVGFTETENYKACSVDITLQA